MRYFIIIFLLFPFASEAKFKMRAREHYEIHDIKTDTFEETYKGLSNTINFWWEEPYKISYGFYFSPVIAGLNADQDGQNFGDEITYFNIGIEVKYFVWSQLYLRPGFGYSQLKPDSNLNDLEGTNAYLGLGYEYPFKNFGLALEIAYRHAWLEDSVTVHSFTPSIGFHFYDYF